MKGNLNTLYPNGFNANNVLVIETIGQIDAFKTALSEIGLQAEVIELSGKLIRVPTSEDQARKKTGWYVFHHGAEFSAGAFGDWRSGETKKWSSHRIEDLDHDQQQRHRAQTVSYTHLTLPTTPYV